MGLCVERSPEMVIGLLGILKAGGAYLPLDPHYPAERLAFMLADAGAPVLVTQAPAAGSGCRRRRAPHWCGSTPTGRAIARQPEHAPALDLDPRHPAYVIYTSGSTGTPKGVVVEHAGHSKSWQRAQIEPTLALRLGARVLQFASLSFDAAISEIGDGVDVGRVRLCLPTAERTRRCSGAISSANEVLLMRRCRPSLLAESVRGRCRLQTLIVAGEACPPEYGRDVGRTGRRMINAYGPTETTVCATMSDALTGDDRVPPIGRPIWNTRVYVLDGGLGACSVLGLLGSFTLRVLGLARGYLGRSGLTAERFVADPYGAAGSRMYRTRGPGALACGRGAGVSGSCGRADEAARVPD